MTYYKATRPDGYSFRGDPPVLYKVGRTVRPHRSSVKGRDERGYDCEPGWLYASTTPEVAVSHVARWPWRIFEVEGTPVGGDPRKEAFRQLRVIREVPRWEAFGPRGELVERILTRSESLTGNEADALAAARYAAWYAARDAAWYAAWDAASDAVRGAVRGAARDAARDAAWYAAWGAVWDAVRDAVRDAAWGAVVSDLVGQHGLTEAHIRTLYGPWQEVIGEPDIEELLA